jgi:hypothetical protein
MAKYFTRIELLNANEHDYELLDIEFKKESFISSTKKKKKGNTRGTSLKEYCKEGNVTLQLVTSAVYKSAKKTEKEFRFTVIRDKGSFPVADRIN